MSGGGRSRLEFLGQLAGGLAHEIKNPLSTMKLTLQLLEEDFAKEQSALAMRSKRKIEVLLKEVSHLDAIVQEFLRLARGSEIKLQRTNLADLITELVEFLAEDAARRRINLRVTIEGDLDGLMLDGMMIRQALLNLVINAFEAMDENGGDVFIHAKRQGDAAVVEVIDSGCGISAANMDRMFRPYFTTKKGGTGMGLAMVQRIVHEHGGQVNFDSVEGKGSRFVMLLPTDPKKGEDLQAMVRVPVHPMKPQEPENVKRVKARTAKVKPTKVKK
ncbi:MAG: two-component sensor histidine kinase [Planctomycetes bacterium]|nr:two-component sensor histidine kinase [Planctomycetota bacterium]